MSKLELILLGRFECLLSTGTRISLPMRKAEVLLAFLALSPGLRHPRERLINLLWSDRGEEQARNSLRQCLSTIRKSLGEAADLVLQVDRTTVTLKPELVEVDALEFERLALEGGFESLTTAAALYQGEFLEGISIRDAACQEWLDGERGRFKRQFVEILSNVAETQLVSHDFAGAVRSAEHLVKQDPLGEHGWRLLMRAYADGGDRSHALQAYKRCAQVLADELEVTPEAATLELRERIAAGDARQPPAIDPAAATQPPAAIEPAASAESPAPTTIFAPPVSTDHSIAVLPFDNLSGDPEQEYFSDGITESITLNLSLFPGLHVKSRNSSFAFKQKLKGLSEISRELEVDYLVEGSIRKTDARVRITAQLIEAASGNQIWGKRYDADLADLFELEEDLSRTIAATVTGQIESELQRIAIAKGAAGQESYDLLLGGIYHAQRFNQKDMVVAIEQLNRCLEQDPDNARAHAWLYACHGMNFLDRWTEDHRHSMDLAETHIRRALELDPEDGLVQVFFAELLIYQGRHAEARKHLDKALKINPNDPNALTTLALCLETSGEPEAALEAADRALRLDPYHPWAEWELVLSRYLCGEYEAVLDTLANLRSSPGFTLIYGIAANVRLGRMEVARAALSEFLRACRNSMQSMPRSIDDWYRWTRENYPFTDAAINREILDCLVEAGLEEAIAEPAAQPDSNGQSIVVLPFDNLSGDPAQEYFSDGITESVILNLSLFPGLSVRSRNASFAFKEQLKSPGEISRELGVDYVVEGSIRKSDQRVRVTVQLFDADGGNQVWGKRYDADIDDLFALEEELSRQIAATVTGQIEADLQRIAIAKGAVSLEAYDLLLAGEYHLEQHNASDNQIAIENLNRCLALDPDNVRAHVTLYFCHMLNLMDRWFADYEQSRKLAEEHVLKAVSLNPQRDYVKVAYAEYLYFRYRYDEAERLLRQVLDINPNNAEAIAQRAVSLCCQGQAEAALEQAEFAIRLDPYQSWFNWIKAEALLFCGRYEDCLETIKNTANVPGFVLIFNVAANTELGRLDQARDTLTTFLEYCRDNMASMPRNIEEWLQYSRDNAPYADPTVNKFFIDCMLQAGLREQQKDADVPAPAIAVLPFKNISGDSEQEYFSDGITDSIIFGLGLFNGLAVRSRQSSFNYRGSDKSMREIAAELDVQYLVEGSIRKSGEMVHIATQLIETESDSRIWSRQYDARLDDIFELQQNLSRTIAATISGRIGHKLQQSAARKPAGNSTSYDYLLRGLYHFGRFTAADLEIAREELQKCIAIDPANPEAHSNLAMIYLTEQLENWTADRDLAIELSGRHSEQAVKHDPDHARARAYFAEFLLVCRDYDQAAFQADKAIELNPAGSEGYAVKASILGYIGRYEEALEHADRCFRMDPHSAASGWIAGEVYRDCGEYRKALAAFRSMPYSSTSVQAQIAACLAGLDRIDEARREMTRYHRLALEQMPNYPQTEAQWRTYWRDVLPYKYDKDFNLFFDLLLKAGLCEAQNRVDDEVPSIAVLPFENMSGEAEQEHFADGITSDLIDTLSRFRHLRTVSRYSTLPYKNDKPPIAQIAEQQQVRYILEGNVRKSGNRVRVSAELIDARTDGIIWSQRFDRDLEDLFAVQDELTHSIALAMKVQLDDGEMARLRSKGTSNVRAWELIMTAVDLGDTYIRRNILDARRMAEQAIELDPAYPYAWIALGWTYWQEAYSGSSPSIEDSIDEAEKANDKAYELDPDYAEVWNQRAMLHLMRHETEAAIAACLKAVELEPGSAEIQGLAAFTHIFAGQYQTAKKYNQNMLRLSPFRANWHYLPEGQIEVATGSLEKAAELYRQGVAVEPDSPLCRYFLIDIMLQLGDEAAARQYADEIHALDQSVSARGIVQSYSADPELREAFRDRLARFGLA